MAGLDGAARRHRHRGDRAALNHARDDGVVPSRRVRRSAVGGLAVALLLAGCSGDDAPDAAASSDSTTTTDSRDGDSTTRPPRSTTTGNPSAGDPVDGDNEPDAAASSDSTTSTRPPTTTTADTPPRPPAPAGVIESSIRTPDGRDRTYRLFVPTSLPSGRNVPLVVAMHGGTGWGAAMAAISGYDAIATREGFVVVYPDGVGTGADGDAFRTWNAGACCGPAMNQNVDDVTFIHQLVDHIDERYPIDGQRIFGIGHSNGGMLAYRLACENPGRFAAFGLQAGTLGVDRCAPTRPTSLMHLHGTDDQNLPIDGGVGPASISGVDYRSAAESLQMLTAAIRCSGPVGGGDPTNPDISTQRWQCNAGTEVILMTVDGAPHSWMGRPAPRGGESYMGLDASVVLWEFVSSHPRR
jgi:polyhydroxybutyrate depolymerase